MLCKVRKKLIHFSSEELIRQKTIEFLQNKIKVPLEMIEVEFPLTKFNKKNKKRIDIGVFAENTSGNKVPVLIVECKSPSVPITFSTFEQAFQYDDEIQADHVLIYNGEEMYFMSYQSSEDKYFEVETIPTYEQLVAETPLPLKKAETEKLKKLPFKFFTDPAVQDAFLDFGWYGIDTSRDLIPLALNFAYLVNDDHDILKSNKYKGIQILKDLGVRFESYGNAAGGSYPGYYRSFLIEDYKHNHQVVSLSIFGTAKHSQDKVFGTRSSNTYLIVALDDFKKSHNSLQLNIDKYTNIHTNHYDVWHDGKMAVGRQGSAKKQHVIDYVQKLAPELICDKGRIKIGAVNRDKQMDWSQKETITFMMNLIKYSLLRDELRELIKDRKI